MPNFNEIRIPKELLSVSKGERRLGSMLSVSLSGIFTCLELSVLVTVSGKVLLSARLDQNSTQVFVPVVFVITAFMA